MSDKMLANKWIILDRLHTLRTIARSFSDGHYDDNGFDREVFNRICNTITEEIRTLTDEIKRREGRA